MRASQGYHGCAIGKGRQAARTEIEKLQLSNMTVREALKEVARIVYVIHDDVKDKPFELELSWVSAETHGRHELVPAELLSEAKAHAQAAKDAMDEDE